MKLNRHYLFDMTLVILSKWDKLVATTLNPSNPGLVSFTDECIQNLISQSEQEQENVRNLLIEGIVDRPKIIDKQQYVQVNQAMLIRLIDKLYSYKQKDGLCNNILYLYTTISQHLENILDFVEDFFGNYFDRNEKVPAAYLIISIEELGRQSKILKQTLEFNGTINPELINILVNNFNKFCIPKIHGATYYELVYQKDLMNELLTEKTLESEGTIREVLFYFNFNDDEYVAYVYNKLTALTESLPTKIEKIAALRFEQKNINQLGTKLNCCLCCTMPSLKEQINHWVEEEIKFLETDLTFEKPHTTDNELDEKIHTSLSVAKLALLIKLMVIDKIITNRVVAHVLRTVIKTVTTLQKENIAFGSLETKYHNPDRGTICAVKDMLFRWINILNKL